MDYSCSRSNGTFIIVMMFVFAMLINKVVQVFWEWKDYLKSTESKVNLC